MKTSESERRYAYSRLKDFILYLTIALVIGIVAVAIASTKISDDGFVRWGGLLVNTVVIFGYFISDSRSSLRLPSFWAMVCLLFVAHTSAFSLVLLHVKTWKLIWFLVMYPELLLFAFVRNSFLRSHGRRN